MADDLRQPFLAGDDDTESVSSRRAASEPGDIRNEQQHRTISGIRTGLRRQASRPGFGQVFDSISKFSYIFNCGGALLLLLVHVLANVLF